MRAACISTTPGLGAPMTPCQGQRTQANALFDVWSDGKPSLSLDDLRKRLRVDEVEDVHTLEDTRFQVLDFVEASEETGLGRGLG